MSQSWVPWPVINDEARKRSFRNLSEEERSKRRESEHRGWAHRPSPSVSRGGWSPGGPRPFPSIATATSGSLQQVIHGTWESLCVAWGSQTAESLWKQELNSGVSLSLLESLSLGYVLEAPGLPRFPLGYSLFSALWHASSPQVRPSQSPRASLSSPSSRCLFKQLLQDFACWASLLL